MLFFLIDTIRQIYFVKFWKDVFIIKNCPEFVFKEIADEYLNSKTNISVYLVDINGRLISTFVFPAHQRHKIVKTGNISNGIYFCCFMIGDELIENFKLEIIRR